MSMIGLLSEHTRVVDTDKVEKTIREIHETTDLRIGCVSNVGVPAGMVRLTFLSHDAFRPLASDEEVEAARTKVSALLKG